MAVARAFWRGTYVFYHSGRLDNFISRRSRATARPCLPGIEDLRRERRALEDVHVGMTGVLVL